MNFIIVIAIFTVGQVLDITESSTNFHNELVGIELSNEFLIGIDNGHPGAKSEQRKNHMKKNHHLSFSSNNNNIDIRNPQPTDEAQNRQRRKKLKKRKRIKNSNNTIDIKDSNNILSNNNNIESSLLENYENMGSMSLKPDDQFVKNYNNKNKTERMKKNNKQKLSRLKKLQKEENKRKNEEKLLRREEKKRLREEKKARREKKRLERLLNGNNVSTEISTTTTIIPVPITTTTTTLLPKLHEFQEIDHIFFTINSNDDDMNDKNQTMNKKNLIIGDFSCIKNGFISAPKIMNADIKYLRNDKDGIENSYLEAEYICKSGYQLYNLNHNEINSIKLICKNFKWEGDLPQCELTKKISNKTVDCKKTEKCEQNCYRNLTTGNDICVCYKGFDLIENKCVDINECQLNKSLCEYGCMNTIGSYRCKCPKGLRIDSSNRCVDLNECLLRNGHGMCQDKCVNTWGSYKCSCDNLPGTQLASDNQSCEDLDACSTNNGGCSHTCLNTMGQVFCICPDGWILSDDWKTCVDIDECADQNALYIGDRCDYGCVNTIGSYKCDTEIGADQPIVEEMKSCGFGYAFNSTTEYCEDINECETNNGGCFHRCINTVGNFDCICKPGYVFGSDKYTCILSNITTDVACPPLFPPRHGYLECSRPIGQRIVNRPGSQCILRCPNGFRVVGRFSKTCGIDGKWIGEGGGACIRYPIPKLMCPKNINAELPPDESAVKINIPNPRTDVNLERDVTVDPIWLKNSQIFRTGILNVTITAKNPISRLKCSCSYSISVENGKPPSIVYCPETQRYKLKRFNEHIKISWTEPIFTDNINVTEIFRTNVPGNYFGIGSHQIIYEAKDAAGYSNKCIFKIIVTSPKIHTQRYLPLF